MRRTLMAALLAAVALGSGPALAASRTVTLKVDGMTCASCPYIVRETLRRLPGVETAEVSFETKQAVVTFDDAKTTVAALTAATAGAGFPSHPAE